ncbi:myotubularin-related protein DDB_G0290005 isoform X2 [Tetranychus urticae]|uniref:myotubularin-related protein DDB_G0290005 isoform X2 n=1 Tax=Tetranychus urticae TaxID=32264 RepID=UPI00077BA608|nr:myotubularin-related protein DDB_G0290005 isoform X2 [Tetranychus urticae]
MIGGAFALKRKRKRELEEKRNGSVQDSILPGILSFGQQFYPSENRPTHQKLSPEQSEDDLHKPSSPSWIQIPINSDLQHENYNHRHHQHHHHHLHHNQVHKHDKNGNAKHSKEPKYQLSGRLTETMSSIILDPSKLNKQSPGLNAEQPPFLINQQLITSLASSIDSTCEENYHDSVNKNLSLGELKQTGSDDIKQRSNNTSPSFQLLTPISINDV